MPHQARSFLPSIRRVWFVSSAAMALSQKRPIFLALLFLLLSIGCSPISSKATLDHHKADVSAVSPPNLPARVERDLVYAGPSVAENPRRLDVYLPAQTLKPFPLVVWFHGGGLTAGTKNNSLDQQVAERWVARGIGIVNVDYRLAPTVGFPAYLEDAAKAVAWAVKEAAALGADPQAIYVGGYSAGAYLATMLGMDERYLRDAGVAPEKIAGFMSLSGQMTTHFRVRKERGLSDLPLIVDDAAPAFFIRESMPKLLLLIGDHDWPARLEENQLMAAEASKVAKSANVTFQVVADRTHATVFEQLLMPDDAAGKAMMRFMQR